MEARKSGDVGHSSQKEFFREYVGAKVSVTFLVGNTYDTTLIWEDKFTFFVQGGAYPRGKLIFKHAVEGIEPQKK